MLNGKQYDPDQLTLSTLFLKEDIELRKIVDTVCILLFIFIFRVKEKKCANSNKSHLFFPSPEMFKKPLLLKCGPRSDCSYRSSLFWVQAVCFYT